MDDNSGIPQHFPLYFTIKIYNIDAQQLLLRHIEKALCQMVLLLQSFTCANLSYDYKLIYTVKYQDVNNFKESI